MRKKILVIDDSDLVQKLYRHRLSQEGYEVIAVGTAEAGLEAMSEHHPDLVLLDLGLPDLDGLEALERMKADPQLAPIPVIVLSARECGDQVATALSRGAADFLSKTSTKPKEVSAAIERQIRPTPGAERSYKLYVDPISLDSHDFAAALGMDSLACPDCAKPLAVELLLDPWAKENAAFRGRVICTHCESSAARSDRASQAVA